MPKYLFLCLAIVSWGICYGQTDINFGLVANYATPIEMGTQKPLLAADSANLFLLDINKQKDKILLFTLQEQNNALQSVRQQQIDVSAFKDASIKGFVVTRDLIIILFFQQLGIFKRNAVAVLTPARIYRNIDYSMIYRAGNDKLILADYYNYTERESRNIRMQHVSVKGNALTFGGKVFRESAYPFYTHLVNKFTDVNDRGDILFTESLPYAITYLPGRNNAGKKVFGIDSLCRYDQTLVDSLAAHNKYALQTGNVNSIIDRTKAADSTTTRIQKIFFLNDSLILVSRMSNHAERTYRFWDLWKTDNRETVRNLFFNKKTKTEYDQGDTGQLFIDVPCFSCSDQMIRFKHYLVRTDIYYPRTLIPSTSTVGNARKTLIKYYEDKTPVYGINLYSYQLLP